MPHVASALVVVTANLLFSNPAAERLAVELEGLAPDVLAVEELSPTMASRLMERGMWPHTALLPRTDRSGIGLLSTAPIEDVELVDLLGSPAVRGRTHGWTVLVVHLDAPGDRAALRLRNRQLEALTALVEALEDPVLVLGDLNHWPHGRRWRALLQSGLTDCGRGIGRTWPTGRAGPPVRIDHVLVSSEHSCSGARTSPGAGSDHRAVVATVE